VTVNVERFDARTWPEDALDVPGGLSTLHVDRDEDRGRYLEPNVWVQHR
jgi:hypothetical protein